MTSTLDHFTDARRASDGEWPYTLAQTVAPAQEPFTDINAVKLACRIWSTAEDALIPDWISTARETCESYMDRQFIAATWKLTAPWFPAPTPSNPFGSIMLPKPPLIGSVVVQYLDVNNVLQTYSSANYNVEAPTKQQGRIHLGYGLFWPSLLTFPQALQITFQAGYGSTGAAVPHRIRQAMLLLIDHMNWNRGATVEGGKLTEIPFGVKSLLDSESWGAVL